MAEIAVQSFLSAAAGIAVAVALTRGFARRGSETIGNFWVDSTCTTLYILLPICVLAGLFLAWQGVPQTFAGPAAVRTLEGATQTISMGPVASREAVKLLSGDGGGFFNAQSAHRRRRHRLAVAAASAPAATMHRLPLATRSFSTRLTALTGSRRALP